MFLGSDISILYELIVYLVIIGQILHSLLHLFVHTCYILFEMNNELQIQC